MSYLSRAIPAVFAVAIFSLAWRQGNVEASYIPKPFELLVALALALILFEIVVSKEARSAAAHMGHVRQRYGVLLAGFTVFMATSTIASVLSFPETALFAKEIVFEYVRVFFAFLLFFATVYIVVRYKERIRWFLGSLVLSPLIFYLAFVPRLQGFFVNNSRLIGAQNDPNYTASFIAVGFLTAAVFFLFTRSRLRWLGALYIVLAMPLFLWANSRGMILSAIVSLLLLTAYYLFRGYSWGRVGSVTALLAVFLLSASVAFFILPEGTRIAIYRRSVAPILQSEALRDDAVDLLAGDSPEAVSAPNDYFGLSRGSLWRGALKEAARSPLGFGPAYHHWNPIDRGTGAHNLWLQVPLTAGWGGLAVWLAILASVFRSARRALRRTGVVGTSLAVSLLFLLTSGIFVDMFTLRWLWLIMGMIVGYDVLTKDENTEGISHSSHA